MNYMAKPVWSDDETINVNIWNAIGINNRKNKKKKKRRKKIVCADEVLSAHTVHEIVHSHSLIQCQARRAMLAHRVWNALESSVTYSIAAQEHMHNVEYTHTQRNTHVGDIDIVLNNLRVRWTPGSF